MSPTGRPEGEYRSAQHEGSPLSPTGHPEGEYRSAQHEGNPVSAVDGEAADWSEGSGRAGLSSATPVLAVAGLVRAFGGVVAVREVSFDVYAGEIVALIGPNGAGKTTCFNLIHGQVAPDAGTVRLAGERIDGLPPHVLARRGVGRTFQVAATVASMTVRENVELALAAHAGDTWRPVGRLDGPRRAAADALLERVGMTRLADQGCGTLAYGDAKRVELAIALAGAPRLLLMDEPTAGMAPRSRQRLMGLAAELARRDGIAVLFTEHDMDVVFATADRVLVLDRGALIAAGPPAAIRADPRVRAVYLGEDTDDASAPVNAGRSAAR